MREGKKLELSIREEKRRAGKRERGVGEEQQAG